MIGAACESANGRPGETDGSDTTTAAGSSGSSRSGGSTGDATPGTTTGATSGSSDGNSTGGATEGVVTAGTAATDGTGVGGSSDGGDGDTETGTDGTTSGTTTGAGQAPGLWLLSISNATKELLLIDLQAGTTTTLCQLATDDGYPSLTFSREGDLYASNNTQDRLDLIDPCTCDLTPIGSYGFQSAFVGITTDQQTDLFGLDKLGDLLAGIDTESGAAAEIGDLGQDLGNSGATWSDATQSLFLINAADDHLYEVDPVTADMQVIAPLSRDFTLVGIELHPEDDTIYACDNDGKLYTVDQQTGNVTEIGVVGGNPCNNLAAPYKPVPCIDD